MTTTSNAAQNQGQDNQQLPPANQTPATQPPAVASNPAPSPSERFMLAVDREVGQQVGKVALTEFQRKLIQNYFIKIDMVMKDAEQRRMAKNEKYRDPLPYDWKNVNLQKLALDVIAYSSVGLDPLQDNHINPIPYKNNNLQKYEITFIPGYKGEQIKASKYGIDVPDEVIVELVYSTDSFRAIKKDKSNDVESYEFNINDPFNRGEIIGGFWYHRFFNEPKKNRLRVFSKADIDKRRPDKASPEFWGGEKTTWENGKPTGKEIVEGWYDEMAFKTIFKNAWKSITIDSQKIDDALRMIIERESQKLDEQVIKQIQENANGAGTNAPAIGFEDTPQTPEPVVQHPSIESEAPSAPVPGESTPDPVVSAPAADPTTDLPSPGGQIKAPF